MTSLEPCRVLVVEDDYYQADDVARILARENIGVVGPCPNEAAAIEALDRDSAHCAVLDVNLGHGASFVLADLLRERGVPFVFFTGYDQQIVPVRFDDVPRLQKPIATARLVHEIERLCASKSAQNY